MARLNFIKNKALLTCLAGGILATACTPTISQHGNMLTDHQIDEVAPNVHTRSDVLKLLGSPSSIAAFDNNTWYYIGQETEKKGILDPKIVEERIVVVKFDSEGTLLSIADIDGKKFDIPVSEDQTVTHGNDLTVLQQILGNVGRFNPQE